MANYPTDQEARQAILDIGRRMYEKNFVAANDGNISCKSGDDRIWCTPTGVSKGYMTEDMLVCMDVEGNVLEGSWKPSSEMKMHLRCYKDNPEIKGVCHAHPPVSTAFAVAGIPIDKAILTESILGLGVVPVAEYAMPGTEGIPESIAPFVNEYNACLLANHGALTWGRTLQEAWMRMELVENCALINMYTFNILGKANWLKKEQVDCLIERRTREGVLSGGYPKLEEDK